MSAEAASDVLPQLRPAALPTAFEGLPATILEALQARRRTPDDDFVIGADFRLTYGEADAASAVLAGRLLAAGIGKGSRVGILFANDSSWVISWLAAARIGALTVPLSTFSPGLELARTISHTDVAAIMCSEDFAGSSLTDRLEQALPGLAAAGVDLQLPTAPFLRWISVTAGKAAWSRELPPPLTAAVVEAAERQVVAADDLIIVSTSGSTSAPKSVVHTHGSMVRHAALLAARRELTRTDRIYSPMPFFWVGGLTLVLLGALTSGAAALVQERFEAGAALDLAERERATQISCWPNASQALAQHPTFAARDLSSVRGGTLLEALPPAHRPPAADRAPMPLGMTETGGPHTAADDAYLPVPEHLRGTFGRSLPGVQHLVADPAGNRPLGPDEVGELLVRGPLVMGSIYKVERHATFTPDGWYRTGDLGSFDSGGYLRFQGRRTAMIKSGGSNVSPAEVEAVLGTIPGVRESYVFGVPAGERGEDVVSVVVPKEGAELASEELRSQARSALSSFKVPSQFKIVSIQQLPMLPTGKVDLAALRSLFSSPGG
jgi:acyl-CoA synthetase (AMP-forming)/AMP-acid ligase II